MSSERGCRERQHASDAEEEEEKSGRRNNQQDGGGDGGRVTAAAAAAASSSRNTSHEQQQAVIPTTEEGGVKRSSGASIWSPHIFHRSQNNKSPHQPALLNPLQYLNNEYQKQGSMANQRQQLKVTTRKSRSPARRSSPNTRSSSKAGSPISEAPTHSSHLYNPPHLHFTHQQPVKETHLLDIDFDPISGRKCINRYEIIDEIGRGTHGKVKLGRDLLSSEHVAIKIVERNTRPRLGKMVKQEDEKVRREIAILKKCRHNNVVRLIEVIDDPASKKVYLVLEYVELGEIAWRKLGHRDVLRRERLRLKQELVGEDAGLSDLQDEDEENLRRWKRRRRKQLKLQHHLSYPPSRSQSRSVNDENPNCWSLELGGLTEEDDGEISDDYPSVDEDDDQVSRSLFEENRPQVDAPHIPPLDSDSEEPTLFMRSLSMMAISGNPEAPPYSFSHEDLQYVPALTFEQARTTFRDTVLGLEYLHYNGIIHRDIKPANLLWTKEYRVKISDFGVSYLGRGAGDYDEDEFGEKKKKKDQVSGRDEEIELAKTVGTPAFFAPELCFFDTSKTRPQITSAIDVWALGVTLYCLVFARCPFLADGEFELFNVIAKQELYIPKRRLRPAQSYIAASSLSRPSSSSRPRSLHQRSQSSASSNSAPTYARPVSGTRGKSYSEDNETELIPDDLRDLLEKLLTKDPAKRISIREVKRHPWVLYGLDNPFQWIEETDPERMSGGGRIEVNQEEMEKAVVPASWGTSVIGRVRSGINKLRQKMGMGGSSDGGGNKKEKVGLHPLASRPSNISISREGLYPYPSVQRPGSSSSVSTLQEQIGAMNKFSLSNKPNTPYNSSNLAVPPTSASSLTRLLNGSSPTRTPISNNGVPTISPPMDMRRLSPSPQPTPASPNSIKKFFNPSQTSLATLSRSISRSSHNSAFSGTESTSPTRTATDTEGPGKKGRSLSLLRRTRSTLSGGERASSRDSSRLNSTRTVRRTTSSTLGQELNSSPATSSHSTVTVRRCPSSDAPVTPSRTTLSSVPAGNEPPPQIQFSLQPHRITSSPGIPITASSSRSRRSSASSNSNSINHARDTVTGALGGLFGKGKRLVRSFSRSRDTLASESEAVASGSGGSGDEEREKEKGLRISMLRKKRSHGVEAGPVLSRVYARGNVSSPMGESIAEGQNVGPGVDGYFDVSNKGLDGLEDTPGSNDTIIPTSTALSSTTNTTNATTTANSSTSASSNALMDQNFPDDTPLFKGHETKSKSGSDMSCPPSPGDYFEKERQARIQRERLRCEVDREEAEKMARYLEASLAREVNKGGRSDSPVFPQVPITCGVNVPPQHSSGYMHGTDDNLNLASSSSEEKIYDQRHHTGTGTSTSLTESNSFPSIQSMLDSSAPSSVSADGGWGVSTLKSPGRAIALNSSNPANATANPAIDNGSYVLDNTIAPAAAIGAVNKDARDSGFYVNDSQSVYSSHHKHHISSGSAQIPVVIESPSLASAYQGYIHSKSDEEDDGDDEALYMGLGTTTRRKSTQLGVSGKDGSEQPVAKNKAIPPSVLHHHKRAVSSTSQRSSRADDKISVNGSPAKDGKERVRRRRSSKGASSAGSGSGRGRSRSNTASSALAPPPHIPTMGGSATANDSHVGGGRRERERRGDERRGEKEERDRERGQKALTVPNA